MAKFVLLMLFSSARVLLKFYKILRVYLFPIQRLDWFRRPPCTNELLLAKFKKRSYLHDEDTSKLYENNHSPYQHSSSWMPPAGFWSSECIRVLGSYETLCVSLALSPGRACPYTDSRRPPYIVLRFSWTATGGSRWPTRACHAATGCLSLRSSSTRSRPFLKER